MTTQENETAPTRCAPPPELDRHPLHVLKRNGEEAYVRWQEGKWIFYRGQDHDPRTPEEAAGSGWRYVGPRLVEPSVRRPPE